MDTIQILASNGKREGMRVLAVKGPVTIHTIFDFQNVVRADSAPAMIFDFSAVPYVDSAGLGAMVGAVVTLQKANRKIAFSGMNEKVTALVQMSHLSQVIRNYPTVEEAETAVS